MAAQEGKLKKPPLLGEKKEKRTGKPMRSLDVGKRKRDGNLF